jgi:hypothetical protein
MDHAFLALAFLGLLIAPALIVLGSNTGHESPTR